MSTIIDYDCDVSEIITEADKALCLEEETPNLPLGFPIKGEKGTVAVKCKHTSKTIKRDNDESCKETVQITPGTNTCWAPHGLRYALRHQVGESNPLKKLQHTVEGKYKFDGCCAMNTYPLLRENNSKQMRFHSQIETETIDSLLDRMETKYSEDAEKPNDMRTDEENKEEIIMDLDIWNGNVQLKTPPSFSTVWAEKPLKEFLLLYYSARDRLDFYEQLRKRIEESSGKVTMWDNEHYAALNNAIPTVDDLASYLFAFVALQPEQLTLATSVTKRRKHDYVLEKLNQMSTGSRLTYEQTQELVTMGFRALDPSIFDDINSPLLDLEQTLTDIIRRVPPSSCSCGCVASWGESLR